MIPTPEYFIAMWQYVIWADNAQWAATRGLSDAQYFEERGWSFGNIHKVMLHQLAVEQSWLDRFQKQKTAWLADEPRMAARDAVAPQWRETHEAFAEFLSRQSTSSLEAGVTVSNSRGETFSSQLGRLLIHVINHAAQHRGQLNSMISLAGGTAATVDYSFYLRKS